MKIIPAIDIQNGSCVRLVKGNFNQSTTYNKSPDKQAKFFFENGFDHIHIIDLDGTQNGKKINTDIAARIANDLGLKVQFGGGIREIHDIDNLLNNGISKVIVGTMIFKDSDTLKSLKNNFDQNQIIYALDFRRVKNIYCVCTHGWQEETNVDIFDFISEHEFTNILATDIDKDGLLGGPNIDVYRNILKISESINLIASGGISSLKDIDNLKKIKIKETIVGKAIYENKISLKDLKEC